MCAYKEEIITRTPLHSLIPNVACQIIVLRLNSAVTPLLHLLSQGVRTIQTKDANIDFILYFKIKVKPV